MKQIGECYHPKSLPFSQVRRMVETFRVFLKELHGRQATVYTGESRTFVSSEDQFWYTPLWLNTVSLLFFVFSCLLLVVNSIIVKACYYTVIEL